EFLNIGTEFEGMTSGNLSPGIEELEIGFSFEKGQSDISHCKCTDRAIDCQSRKAAGVNRTEVDVRHTDLGGSVLIGIELQLRNDNPRECEAEVLLQGGGKGPLVVDHRAIYVIR